MRNQAQSPKVQHVLSALLSSLLSLICRSEQLKLRIRIGDTQSARHAQVVAVAVNERGGERDGTHKQMNNSNHNATTLLSLLRCCCCCWRCLLPIKVTSASAASAIAIYGLDLCISATGSLMRTHRRTKQTLNTHTHACIHMHTLIQWGRVY